MKHLYLFNIICFCAIKVIADDQCNKYFFYNKTTKKCEIYDEATQPKYQKKFPLSSFDKSYIKQIEHTQNTLIGPITQKSSNNLYFLSLISNTTFDLSDYSFVKFSNKEIEGFAFMLSEHNSTEEEKDGYIYVYNIKELHNIGKVLDKIAMIPELYRKEGDSKVNIEEGIMMKYINGDICNKDNNTRYQSYVFLLCDNKEYFSVPYFVKEYKDECTFVFELYSRYACPICHKKENKYINGGCVRGKKKIYYSEEEQCIIYPEGQNKMQEQLEQINLSQDQLAKMYLEEKYGPPLIQSSNVGDSSSFELNIDNLNDNQIYIFEKIQEIDCDLYTENFNYFIENKWKVLMLCLVGIVYFGLMIALLIICLKYRTINQEYTRIRQGIEITDIGNDKQDEVNVLEMGNIS